ncbi:MAG: oxidoreductase, partial [Desulfobacteraceae bacterium]|nr:oxidoreductase [Desulfobacteraceae bacterium]
MNLKISQHDINLEPFMSKPPDFNRKSILMQTERDIKSEIVNIIPLTSQEKLFHIKILDPCEREQ